MNARAVAGRLRPEIEALREAASVQARELRRWAQANPDLALYSGLLVAIATFGRPLAKVGAGGIYVTEVALVAIVVLALRRTGLRGAWERVRLVVPLLPLAVLWVAGAIAAVRGIYGYGLASTLKDVGLVEYSMFIPLAAIVADTRARADTLLRVLSYAGLSATAVFALVYFFAPYSALGIVENPTSAVGVYLALYVLPVAARLTYRQRPAAWELGVAAAALVLMAFGAGRSVLVALVLSLLVVVALSPRPVRTAAISLAGVTAAVVIAIGLQTVGFGDHGHTSLIVRPVAATVGTGLVLDDALNPAVGGKVVDGYASEGVKSREAHVLEPVEIAFLHGLVTGEIYTVSFDVLPLDPTSTRGIVGNNAGTGWGFVFWSVTPDRSWQHVVARLQATAPTERLMLQPDAGTLGVRFDRVRVTRGVSGPSGTDAHEREPVLGGPDQITLTPPKDSSLLSAIVDSFDRRAATGEFQNANWRLDYWGYLLRKARDDPAFGVGFGRPAAFHWNEFVYDTRKDGDIEAVSPPHNSFINLLYRTGAVGLAGLLALVAIAVVRMFGLLHATAAEKRPPLVALAGLLVFITVIAALNVALEGPYMSMFFWTVLGLMFILPRAPRTAPNED